jgi:hypothetical protein
MTESTPVLHPIGSQEELRIDADFAGALYQKIYNEMRTAYLSLPVAAFLAASLQAASPTSVTLNPTQDAFVSSANAGNNYGSAGALLVNAAGLSKGEFDSLLQFNLASAKSTFDSTYGVGLWSVQSITLQLTSAMPNNGIFNSPAAAGSFTLTWMQNDSWLEGSGTPMSQPVPVDGITYTTLPSFRSGSDQVLGTYSFLGGTSGNSTYTLGLNSFFVDDVMGGNYVSLLALPADSAIVYTANSQNFGTSSSRPLLTVTAVGIPEPGSALLLFAGAGVGLLPKRRTRRA